MKQFLVAIALSLAASSLVVGYEPQSAQALSIAPEATPAYAVLVLRKAAVEAELAQLSEQVTSTHLSVISKRFELQAINLEMEKMRAVKPSHVARMSSSVGNLILSKVALEVELNELLSSYTSQHPEVKKKNFELAALNRETKKILR